MASNKCQCDLLKSKSSHYYYEALSDLICEFCRNEPVIALQKLAQQSPANSTCTTRNAFICNNNEAADRLQGSPDIGTSPTCTSSKRTLDTAAKDTITTWTMTPTKTPSPSPRLSLKKSQSRNCSNQFQTVQLPTPSRRSELATGSLAADEKLLPIAETRVTIDLPLNDSIDNDAGVKNRCGSNSHMSALCAKRRPAQPSWNQLAKDSGSSPSSTCPSSTGHFSSESEISHNEPEFPSNNNNQQQQQLVLPRQCNDRPLKRYKHRRFQRSCFGRHRNRLRCMRSPSWKTCSSSSISSSPRRRKVEEAQANNQTSAKAISGSHNEYIFAESPFMDEEIESEAKTENKTQMQRPEDEQSLSVDNVLQELMKGGVLDTGHDDKKLPHSSGRLSNIFVYRPEPQSAVEKAIRDFFKTHRGDSGWRVLPSDEDTDGLKRSGRHSRLNVGDGTAATDVGSDGKGGGYLLKKPIVVGVLNPFDQSVSRQYILPMFDSLMEDFLNGSSVLRAACQQTKCRLELSRCILNRKMLHGSWSKYIPLTISGPTLNAIDCCDKLIKKYVPDYRFRRVYDKEATCCMYLKEDTPDNAELCFSHQRTGMATTKFAALELQSPFLRSETDSPRMPWKQGLTKYGRAAISKGRSAKCAQYIYANAYGRRTGNVPSYFTGPSAINTGQMMQDEANLMRHVQIEERKKLLLPLSRV